MASTNSPGSNRPRWLNQHPAIPFALTASPTTEAPDRREKLRAYRTLPSLKEYLLVSQEQAQVEIYRRRGDIGWDIITYEPGDTVEIASLETKLGMDEIYFESGIAC